MKRSHDQVEGESPRTKKPCHEKNDISIVSLVTRRDLVPLSIWHTFILPYIKGNGDEKFWETVCSMRLTCKCFRKIVITSEYWTPILFIKRAWCYIANMSICKNLIPCESLHVNNNGDLYELEDFLLMEEFRSFPIKKLTITNSSYQLHSGVYEAIPWAKHLPRTITSLSIYGVPSFTSFCARHLPDSLTSLTLKDSNYPYITHYTSIGYLPKSLTYLDMTHLDITFDPNPHPGEIKGPIQPISELSKSLKFLKMGVNNDNGLRKNDAPVFHEEKYPSTETESMCTYWCSSHMEASYNYIGSFYNLETLEINFSRRTLLGYPRSSWNCISKLLPRKLKVFKAIHEAEDWNSTPCFMDERNNDDSYIPIDFPSELKQMRISVSHLDATFLKSLPQNLESLDLEHVLTLDPDITLYDTQMPMGSLECLPNSLTKMSIDLRRSFACKKDISRIMREINLNVRQLTLTFKKSWKNKIVTYTLHPIEWMAFVGEDDPNGLEYLIEKYSGLYTMSGCVSKPISILHAAVEGGSVNMIRWMMEKLRGFDKIPNKDWITPLPITTFKRRDLKRSVERWERKDQNILKIIMSFPDIINVIKYIE